VGVEISSVALELARDFDPLTTFHDLSVLDLDRLEGEFDAIYGFNILRVNLMRFMVSTFYTCSERKNENCLLICV